MAISFRKNHRLKIARLWNTEQLTVLPYRNPAAVWLILLTWWPMLRNGNWILLGSKTANAPQNLLSSSANIWKINAWEQSAKEGRTQIRIWSNLQRSLLFYAADRIQIIIKDTIKANEKDRKHGWWPHSGLFLLLSIITHPSILYISLYLNHSRISFICAIWSTWNGQRWLQYTQVPSASWGAKVPITDRLMMSGSVVHPYVPEV